MSISLPERTIEIGSVIALRGDSGYYMSRTGSNKEQGVNLSKHKIDDQCRFTVMSLLSGHDKNKLTLKGDNDLYMTRHRTNGQDQLWVSKEKPDEQCYFGYSIDEKSNLIALQGDEDKYMSRHDDKGLLLSKEEIDKHCLFLVVLAD